MNSELLAPGVWQLNKQATCVNESKLLKCGGTSPHPVHSQWKLCLWLQNKNETTLMKQACVCYVQNSDDKSTKTLENAFNVGERGLVKRERKSFYTRSVSSCHSCTCSVHVCPCVRAGKTLSVKWSKPPLGTFNTGNALTRLKPQRCYSKVRMFHLKDFLSS